MGKHGQPEPYAIVYSSQLARHQAGSEQTAQAPVTFINEKTLLDVPQFKTEIGLRKHKGPSLDMMGNCKSATRTGACPAIYLGTRGQVKVEL